MQSSFGVVMLQRSIWACVFLVCTTGTLRDLLADETFPNELNSSVNEPRVLLKEVANGGMVRISSSRTIQTDDSLVKLVFETREAQRRRLLSTTVHTPWQIMHGLLGLRRDFIISHQDKSVNGLEWIASGPQFRNEYWFEKTEFGGRAHPYSIPYAFEGHVNQFLAILSMSGLPLDYEFATADGRITMRDMLANAQKTVNDREEVTWTLWALSRYLPPDAQWRNAAGELWSIERLVKLQVDKPLQGSPCGGTHGLFALAHARNVYLRKGLPLRGVWVEAEQKIRRYIQTARMQQNADGTLSSNFFRGREYKADFDKRMASAGHILEFLMLAMPQEELSQPWVRRAIEATCKDLMQNRHEYVSCSPLYHTVNALSTYLDRVAPATEPAQLVRETDKTRTIGQTRDPESRSVLTIPMTIPGAATSNPAQGSGPDKTASTASDAVSPNAPANSAAVPMAVTADVPTRDESSGAPATSDDTAGVEKSSSSEKSSETPSSAGTSDAVMSAPGETPVPGMSPETPVDAGSVENGDPDTNPTIAPPAAPLKRRLDESVLPPQKAVEGTLQPSIPMQRIAESDLLNPDLSGATKSWRRAPMRLASLPGTSVVVGSPPASDFSMTTTSRTHVIGDGAARPAAEATAASVSSAEPLFLWVRRVIDVRLAALLTADPATPGVLSPPRNVSIGGDADASLPAETPQSAGSLPPGI